MRPRSAWSRAATRCSSTSPPARRTAPSRARAGRPWARAATSSATPCSTARRCSTPRRSRAPAAPRCSRALPPPPPTGGMSPERVSLRNARPAAHYRRPRHGDEGRDVIDARTNRRRLVVAVLAIFAIVIVLSIRLVDIQVVRADSLKTVAGTNFRTDTLWGTRGSIVDANGTVLATSVDRFNITAAPVNVHPAGFERRVEVDGTRKLVRVSVMEALQEISDITGADVQEMYTAL